MTLSLSNHLAEDSVYLALRRDVFDGLQKSPKSLPPKWFYDAVGSELFDRITRLPEYYPTRAEAQILRARSADIAAASSADTLVELGSGTSEKTRLLLNALRDRGLLQRFVPFDVDESVLSAAVSGFKANMPASKSTPSAVISRNTWPRSRPAGVGCSSSWARRLATSRPGPERSSWPAWPR